MVKFSGCFDAPPVDMETGEPRVHGSSTRSGPTDSLMPRSHRSTLALIFKSQDGFNELQWAAARLGARCLEWYERTVERLAADAS